MPHDLFKLEFSADELIIYDFARVFYSMTTGRNDQQGMRFFTANDPRMHGAWHYFRDAYEIVKNDGFFNIRWFIKAQLGHMTKDQKFWPAMLTTRKAFKYYFEYCQSRKIIVKSSKTKDMMYALAQDKKTIQEWFEDHSTEDYSQLFGHIPAGLLMSDGTYYAMQGMISILFLSISKSFRAAYTELDVDMREEIANMEQLILMRNNIRENERVKTFANKIFGAEVIV